MASKLHEIKHEVQKTTKCPACGSKVWLRQVTYSTPIDLTPDYERVGERSQIREELRCAHCARKAIIAAVVGVQETETFQLAKRLEERLINGDQSDLHKRTKLVDASAA